MFTNYLKMALRNFARQKTFTTINILGLSLGICACIAIFHITSYEFGFDSFHPDKERIFRVMGDLTETTGNQLHFAKVPLAVSKNIQQGLPGLDFIAGIIPYDAKIEIPAKGRPDNHFESKIAGTNSSATVFTEPQYFDIFKYEWLAGNSATALNGPYSVVLTEDRARLYFGTGSPDEMIGRQIVYDDSLKVFVSGIIKDWHKNTDLGFTDFISMSTIQNGLPDFGISENSWMQADMSVWTFVKISSGSRPAQIDGRLEQMVKTHTDSKIKLALWLEPLSDIHFNADVIENTIRTAHLPTLYGVMGIALFILILGIMNFINLSTAQSFQRIKEVGVRKLLGSSKTRLVFQFLTE
jgi:putative ABC transport system permease protein